MRTICAIVAGLALLGGAREWRPAGWLKHLQDVAVGREGRPVRLALVTDGDADWERTSDYGFRAVLRDPIARARVFAPGSMGYTHIPPRPKPVTVFINRDRVEPNLLALVAAHELGHVLLHARGYLQVVVMAGSADEPLVADAFNAVQDVLLERELRAARVDTQPLLARQMETVTRALAAGGAAAAVPGTGHANVSHLATMVTPLLLEARGMGAAKQALRDRLPPPVAALVGRYSTILTHPINSAGEYREAVYAACEANRVPRARVRFAED